LGGGGENKFAAAAHISMHISKLQLLKMVLDFWIKRTNFGRSCPPKASIATCLARPPRRFIRVELISHCAYDPSCWL